MPRTLIQDLATEQETLDALVSTLDEATWTKFSTAPGWTLADQIAHLAFADELATNALNGAGEEYFAQLQDKIRVDPTIISAPAHGRAGAEVLDSWRAARTRARASFEATDPSQRILWGPNRMSAKSLCTARLMETWAHGLDCFATLGVVPTDTDRLEHVCRITYLAIPHAMRVAARESPHSLSELTVSLTSATGQTWRFGPEDAPQTITGSASEFARVGVRRMPLAEATSLKARGPFATAALGSLKAYL